MTAARLGWHFKGVWEGLALAVVIVKCAFGPKAIRNNSNCVANLEAGVEVIAPTNFWRKVEAQRKDFWRTTTQ